MAPYTITVRAIGPNTPIDYKERLFAAAKKKKVSINQFALDAILTAIKTSEALGVISETKIPKLTEDAKHEIACEITHDIREMGEEAGLDKVRWNNRAAGMLLNAAEEAANQSKPSS